MSNLAPKKKHGTCVEIDGLGVLLCGPPGSGKSDLALRLIDEGARLVADDYTELSVDDGKLLARAPETIKDLIEVRGLGVLKISAVQQAELGVVINLVPSGEVERLADDQSVNIMDLPVAQFCLTSFEASAPAKVRLIVRKVKSYIVHVP